MSVKAYIEARVLPLNSSQLAIFKELCFHADDNDRAWPAYSTLALYTRLSLSTVKRSINALKKGKLISKDALYRPGSKTICYQINRTLMREIGEQTKRQGYLDRIKKRSQHQSAL